MNKVCLNCGSNFITYPSEIKKGKGKYCSRKCSNIANARLKPVWNKGRTKIYSEDTLYKMSVSKIGKRTGNMINTWKGDEVGYNALHAWVRKYLGKPNKCSKCGFISKNNRQFHWSNISGKYERNKSDWRRLCVSCHYKIDKVHQRGWVTRRKQCV